MPYIQTTSDQTNPVQLFYQDWGSGTPVVLIHGWPLSHEMWEYQLAELPRHGVRCIAYDRRGFGKSDKPWDGYDYDTLASDLKAVLDGLDVRDATLVGFSMGGGEVARYLSHYGADRVSKAVFVSAVPPLLVQKESNPDGVPREQFNQIIEQIAQDRPAFLSDFGKKFFGQGWITRKVSDEILTWSLNLALCGSPKATTDCVRSFSETDFTSDLKKITIPTLVIHGDADKTVPFDISGKKTASMIPHAELQVYSGAPHGLFYTEKDRLNEDLLSFIKK